MASEDYEIRFLNADGSVSLLFVTNCMNDENAREAALKMFAQETNPFEIWRGQTLVGKGPGPSAVQ